MEGFLELILVFLNQLYILVKNTILIRPYSKAEGRGIFTSILNIIAIIISIIILVFVIALSLFLSFMIFDEPDLLFFALTLLFVILFSYGLHLICSNYLGRFKFSSLEEEMEFCKNSEYNCHKILFPLREDNNNGYIVMVVYGGRYSLIPPDESYITPSVYTKYKENKVGITGARTSLKNYCLIGNEERKDIRAARIKNKITNDSMLIVVSKEQILANYNNRALQLLRERDSKYENINCYIYGVLENRKDEKVDCIYIDSNKYQIKRVKKYKNFFHFR